MSIEKRLTDHMAEQAELLTFETSNPSVFAGRPPSGPNRIVSLAAAVVIVAAAGLSFWALSRGDDGGTEIAAGEADEEATEADHEDEAAQADGAEQGLIELTVTDVSDDNNPGSGRTKFDDGVYYTLSTAPGRVRLDENLTEDEWAEIFRLGTFYTLGESGGWQIAEVADRFVSDFDARGGLLYALSTGTLSGSKETAFGTSPDRGRTWDWQTVEGLPKADQLGILAGDSSTVIMASRWGYPDYEKVLELANGAGVGVTEMTLRNFDHEGFSYLAVDPDDRCTSIAVQYGLSDFAMWLREAQSMDDEGALLEAQDQLGYMLEDMGPDLEAAGCEFGIEDISNLPELLPEEVRWADIGVTVPEEWRPWSGLYRYVDGTVVKIEQPFDPDHRVGMIETRNGQLIVTTWDDSIIDGSEGGEVIWTTTDGVDWDSETIRYDEQEESGYYRGPGVTPPVAGQSTFRIWWDEEEMVAYEQEAEASGDNASGDNASRDNAFEETTFVEPAPHLQRSVAGGPWEDVDLAELAPDVDFGDRVIQDLRGTQYGLFMMFAANWGPDGPPEPGMLVLHSNNGTDWGVFKTPGNMVEVIDEPDSMLLLSHRWSTGADDPGETRTLLVRPTSS